jgi:DNA mismatch repair protein MutS
VVKREVIEVVTPGTTLSEKILDQKNNNFLAAVYLEDESCGISYCDISTGEYFTGEVTVERMVDYFQQISPKEILVQTAIYDELEKLFANRLSTILTKVDDWVFNQSYCYEILIEHFGTPNLKGFGLESYDRLQVAAGVILHYIKENYRHELNHLSRVSFLSLDDYMILDTTTRRNLEITTSITEGRKEGTLISILDDTVTAMGARLLKRWITHPLVRLPLINERLGRVKAFYEQNDLRKTARKLMREIADLERLIARISTGRATPRDLIALKNSLKLIEPILTLIESQTDSSLMYYPKNMDVLSEVSDIIENGIVDSPPLNLKEGGIIKDGVSEALDEYRKICREGKNWLVKIQENEREKSNISTLKLSYNRVFGYYFEVTKSHLDKVPEYFIRKQTLVNAERYITPELKEYEEKILGAEEKINDLEYQLFQEIRIRISTFADKIKRNALLIAELDCFASFAEVARHNKYIQPRVNDDSSMEIEIIEGRHPVVEKLLPVDEPFIENDTHLDNKKNQIMILTGPNMAGKSTYLRQVGLISLLAQIGSFVPA